MRILSLSLAGLMLAACARSTPAPEPAPNFKLMRLGGGQISLKDYRGSVVLLDFWASWCGPCRESAPALKALYSEMKPKGLKIIGISLDESVSEAQGFAKAQNLLYEVALTSGMASAVSQDYGANLGIPLFVVVDKRGLIRKRLRGAYPGWEMDLRRYLKTLFEEKS